MRGSSASPVIEVDVVADVSVDVQVGSVFEAIGHRAMRVFFKPPRTSAEIGMVW